MKKIYLLFAMLLGFFAPAVAQEVQDDDFDFSLKTIQMEGVVADFLPNHWYFLYQKRGGPSTFPSIGDVPSTGGVMTDCGEGNRIMKMNISNVSGADLSPEEKKQYFLRFLPVEEKEGCYNIQFGTGLYLKQPNNLSQSQEIKTSSLPEEAGEYNIYSIEPDGQPLGLFGINVYNMSWQIDNNGVDAVICTWGNGEQTTPGANCAWQIIDITWNETTEYDVAMKALEDLYMEYSSSYMDNSGDTPHATFVTGTAPGQYSAEAVADFESAMSAARAAGDPAAGIIPIDEIQALTTNLKNTLEAVLASQVPFALADGYYRIRAAMTYTNDVTVGVNPETGQDIKESQQVNKYMYSTIEGGNIYARWNTPEELESDCPSLWKITNKDGFFDIVSCATDARFNEIAKSKPETMSVDSENLITVDIAGYEEEKGCMVNIRVSTQAAGDYFYLHQDGHASGAGVSGNIVGWATSYTTGNPGGSEWIFELVSDDDAAAIIEGYKDIKYHNQLVAKYNELKTEATAAIEAAKDVQTVELLTDVNQLSSPWTDPQQGSLANLLDGSNTTFWHSSWHDNPPHDVQGSHYLQVALPEGYYKEGLEIKVGFSRRSGATNDHLTTLSIRGTDDGEDADPYTDPLSVKEGLTELLSFNCPFANAEESFTTDYFDPQGFSYLRLYGDATTNNRVYWHISELSIFYQQENPNSQYSKMGQVAIDLENLLTEQADIEEGDIDDNVYNTLLAAYQAFQGNFVDPAELRAVLDSLKNKVESVIVAEGEKVNPGTWASDATAKALQKTIEDAKAYDIAGQYTAIQSETFINTLRQQAAAIDAAVEGIKVGKWYRIRFPSEEMFDQYKWDKVAGNGSKDEQGEFKIQNLYNKVIAVAEFESVEGYEVHEPSTIAEVAVGHALYFVNEDGDALEDPNAALFRFVNVADTAYVLQNKATGLYLKGAGTSGGVTLSVQPSFFDVSAIGYGLNEIHARSLKGENQNYLHGQVSHNVLVTWGPDFVPYPGSRSGLLIEEVEDVTEDYNPTSFNLNLKLGSVNGFCFPVAISSNNEDAVIYGVNAVEGNDITLVPLTEEVAAGRPFICIYGARDDYEEEYDAEPVSFKHGNEFAADPFEGGTLRGAYVATTVGAGVVVPSKNTLAVTKTSTAAVGANGAWIVGEDAFDKDAEVNIIIDGEGEDGIAAALANVSKTGELYSLDGRLISRKANLNTLRKQGRGVYILNGTKVTVK